MSKINAGEIEIVLNGETRILKPTLAAVTSLSRMHGGLGGVRQGLASQNIDVICGVIRYGTGLQDRDMKKLERDVYNSGMGADLVVPLINFIGVLGNGGKPIDDTEEVEGASGSVEGKVEP